MLFRPELLDFAPPVVGRDRPRGQRTRPPRSLEFLETPVRPTASVLSDNGQVSCWCLRSGGWRPWPIRLALWTVGSLNGSSRMFSYTGDGGGGGFLRFGQLHLKHGHPGQEIIRLTFHGLTRAFVPSVNDLTSRQARVFETKNTSCLWRKTISIQP